MGSGSGKQLQPTQSFVNSKKNMETRQQDSMRANQITIPADKSVLKLILQNDYVQLRTLINSSSLQQSELTQTCSTKMLYFTKDTEPSLVEFEDVTGLHLAAFKGYPNIVELLLKKGLNSSSTIKNSKLGLNVTPLHLASLCGNLDVVQILLDYGANLDALDSEKGDFPIVGQTSLHLALRNKQWVVAKFLLNNNASAEVKFFTREGDDYLPHSVFDLVDDEALKGILVRAIENNYTDPEQSLIYGSGIQVEQRLGKKSEFTVALRDKFKSFRKRGSETIKVSIISETDEGDTSNWSIVVKDNENGTYTIQYVPQAVGTYLVSVTLNNFKTYEKGIRETCHIAKSPYPITVAGASVIHDVENTLDTIPVRIVLNSEVVHLQVPVDSTVDSFLKRIEAETHSDIPHDRVVVKKFLDPTASDYDLIMDDEEFKEVILQFRKSDRKKLDLGVDY